MSVALFQLVAGTNGTAFYVELGMHVPAENPELVPNQAGFHGNASEVADIDLPGNRVTSNSDAFEYHFTLQKPSGGQTKIRLLRNGSWLSKQERTWQYSAAAGDWDWHYWIALSELGVEGWSRLEAAQPYSGSHDLALGANGGLVTGIFEHEGSVVDLRFVNESSEEVAITSTPNHRFWSDSRQAFVACGELERGELVRGLTGGQWQLQARQSQPGARSVYNLEVSQEHVFYVGSGGILVHNMCGTGSQGGKHSGGDISGSGRAPANRLTPEAPPTSAPKRTGQGPFGYPSGKTTPTPSRVLPEPKVLQTGGHTLSKRTIKALGIDRSRAHQALTALKKENGLGAKDHGHRFLDNGDVVDSNTGIVLGNLFDYL